MSIKEQIWQAIDERRERYLKLLGDTIRIPSDNPPGDTTAIAAFMRNVLSQYGVTTAVYEPLKGAPNLVAHQLGERPGRHLILNGHLDQFPADPSEPWTVHPYSGEIVDGKVYGRGSGDMKAGTTGSLIAFLLIREFAPSLPGKLTLTMVSDEETGGTWGVKWLLENVPEVRGDAVLNGEPSGPEIAWIGEKGICWYRLTIKAPSGHSALGASDNAVTRMAKAIPAIYSLYADEIDLPPEISAVADSHSARLSVNIGTMKAGVKANVVPGHAEAEVDIRIPPGKDAAWLEQRLHHVLTKAGIEGYSLEPIHVSPPSFTPPAADLVQAVVRNGRLATGTAPQPVLCYAGTDCRFWRYRGIPAVSHGPRVFHMAAPDEHILADEFISNLKTHVGTILDFLDPSA